MAKTTGACTTDGRKLTILGSGSGPARSPRSAPGGVQSEGPSSEELGGGMEVGRRRFGQCRETPLDPGRAQTQPRARRRGLAAYRLGRGCNSHQQTRPTPPSLVTATTGKAASGRCVNREVLRLARATRLMRRDQHEESAMRSMPRRLLVFSMTACRLVIVDGMAA